MISRVRHPARDYEIRSGVSTPRLTVSVRVRGVRGYIAWSNAARLAMGVVESRSTAPADAGEAAVRFTFRPMAARDWREIAGWRYEPPYDCYNFDLAPAAAPPAGYYAVFDEPGALVGFFCFGVDARVPGGDYGDDALDVGLGLRPDLTGRGLGLTFVEAGLAFARREFVPARFRLTVATFNRRAIQVYERAGFAPERVFRRRGDGAEFLQMSRPAGAGGGARHGGGRADRPARAGGA